MILLGYTYNRRPRYYLHFQTDNDVVTRLVVFTWKRWWRHAHGMDTHCPQSHTDIVTVDCPSCSRHGNHGNEKSDCSAPQHNGVYGSQRSHLMNSRSVVAYLRDLLRGEHLAICLWRVARFC